MNRPPRNAPRRLVDLVNLVLAAALVLAGGGCAGRPAAKAPTVPALCQIETTVEGDKPPRDRQYPASYWFVLLLRDYRTSGEIARPARDCRGIPATLLHDTCAADTAAPGVDRPIAAADLHIARISDTRRLVWVATTLLSDGRAEGPVALVDIDATGLAVRALGVLRGYPENVTLRLATVSGTSVLVAEGERCDTMHTKGDDGRATRVCDRAVRLVPLLGDRFVDGAVMDDGARCLESAFVPIRGSGSAPDGTRYQVEGTVVFAPDSITVREQLVLPTAREHVNAGGAFVTRVQEDRKLTVRGGRLIATAPSLLSRWLARHTISLSPFSEAPDGARSRAEPR